jgi:hypothetical protein
LRTFPGIISCLAPLLIQFLVQMSKVL